MGDAWTVRELHVYEDSECEGDPVQATSVFSKPSLPSKEDTIQFTFHVPRHRRHPAREAPVVVGLVTQTLPRLVSLQAWS